nr:putative late blight resistance protein homolog R1A-4 [Ipomoea batatas]GMD45520.1 putative late blight resistance protein homolog R1A-4 [Ipomoea batatas]GMD46962.1 putative late blight resistance protein homolog R1A-4 [Ipomoea batatas]
MLRKTPSVSQRLRSVLKRDATKSYVVDTPNWSMLLQRFTMSCFACVRSKWHVLLLIC